MSRPQIIQDIKWIRRISYSCDVCDTDYGLETSGKPRERVLFDSLMVLSCCTVTSRGGGRGLKVLECFSTPMYTKSVIVSAWAVPVKGSIGARITPPQAVEVSRIEMRLLSDTRSVLEYLPQVGVLVSTQTLCHEIK
jgi:hypothetical protein